MKKALPMRVDEELLNAIDYFRKRSFETRTTWICKAILDRLIVLGYDTTQLWKRSDLEAEKQNNRR